MKGKIKKGCGVYGLCGLLWLMGGSCKAFFYFLSQLRFPILLLLLPPPVPAFFFFLVCLSILTPGFYKRFKILILCVFGDNDHGLEIFIRGGSEGVCVIQGSELMRLALELVWFGWVPLRVN